jgi:hypothetical protein
MSNSALVQAEVLDISNAKEGGEVWANKIRTRAKQLSGQLETGYMELARLLYNVCDTKSTEPPFDPIYKTWGYNSFENYAEEELGINEGKAKALRRAWFRLEVELASMDPADKKAIIALGWSKVNQLVKVLTPQNAKEWAERAAGENYATMCVSVRTYQQNVAKALQEAQKQASTQPAQQYPFDPPSEKTLNVPLPEKQKLYHKYMYFTESQYEIIELALSKAAMLYGKANEAMVLTGLLTEWLSTTITGDGADAKIKYFSKFEKQIGMDLIAVESETDRIVYGYETLERLASKTEGTDVTTDKQTDTDR